MHLFLLFFGDFNRPLLCNYQILEFQELHYMLWPLIYLKQPVVGLKYFAQIQ